jgi:MFS family permease
LYIYDLTGSALATGAMFLTETLPILLFGSLGGVFADRWNRKKIMIMTDVLRAGLLVLTLVGVYRPSGAEAPALSGKLAP